MQLHISNEIILKISSDNIRQGISGWVLCQKNR